MRLLNSRTLKLEEFPDVEHPKYAILSHRWGSEEVLLEDIQEPVAIHKQGYLKIQKACEQAVIDGWQYLWADTCCIDKKNEVELGTAIRSMFKWYKNAAVCYVHLSDVPVSATNIPTTFEESSWFSRGWTLQELIAPSSLVFFDRDWNRLGDKHSLENEITAATHVDSDILRGGAMSHRSVAQRMSWASKRSTTRIEDKAYSLLGIFDVSMTMQYGEGERAFVRLQEEIVKKSRDQSIFAFTSVYDEKNERSLFATSPSAFAACQNIVKEMPMIGPRPFALTNMGLEIQMPLLPWAPRVFLGVLGCRYKDESSPIGIFLEPLSQPNTYARRMFNGQYICNLPWETVTETWNDALVSKLRDETIYIQEIYPHPCVDQFFGFKLGSCTAFNMNDFGNPYPMIYTRGHFSPETKVIEAVPGTLGTVAVILFPFPKGPEGMRSLLLKVGFDGQFNPGFMLSNRAEVPNLRDTRSWPCPASNASSKQLTRILDPSWITRQDDWTLEVSNKEERWTRINWYETSSTYVELTIRATGWSPKVYKISDPGLTVKLKWEDVNSSSMWVITVESNKEIEKRNQVSSGKKKWKEFLRTGSRGQ